MLIKAEEWNFVVSEVSGVIEVLSTEEETPAAEELNSEAVGELSGFEVRNIEPGEECLSVTVAVTALIVLLRRGFEVRSTGIRTLNLVELYPGMRQVGVGGTEVEGPEINSGFGEETQPVGQMTMGQERLVEAG